uniref:Nucleoporin NDC1 n=1 Tax=Kwoniella dejecticola CBS 10117 TaxID=1296121 RepID=A0A1A6A3P4_9TREE|nr:uncharacterized protein I303_05533 [Kwoniella dejecticola CBS 10117]OBR84674.1 hypothetical protein I303_05533 [Kwoniella dejecticola CBS 10117]
MSVIQTRPLPTRTPNNGAGPSKMPTPSQPLTPLAKIEKQYRQFLGKRYMSFAWRTGIWTTVTLSTSIVLYTGSFGKIPLATVLSLPVFVALAILLRIRRSFITQPPTLTPQPTLLASLISALWNERSITLLFSYAIFSLVISNAWCILVGTDDLALFSPTTRHKFALNERRVVLCCSNLALFLILGARDILSDRLKPVWPQKKIPFARAVQNAILDSLTFDTSNSLSLSLFWSIVTPLAYRMVLRGYVWQWVNWRVWALFLRPFIGSFARSSTRAPSAWSLAPQLLVLDLVALTILQLPTKAIMPYITQSPLTPERYLITALKSQDPYYLQFTLMELLRISHVPAHRKALFSDISNSPNLTTELWQELLLQLGRINSRLSAPLPTASTGTAPPPAKPAVPNPRAIPIKQGDIFKPIAKKQSTYGLKEILDGPVGQAPPEPVAKVAQVGTLAIKKAEEVQNHVVGRIEATPIGGNVLSEARGWRQGLYDWLGREWAIRGLRSNARDWLLAQRIIEIMTTFALASVEEDTYGYVQQVLPASLESIVRIRASVISLEGRLSYEAAVTRPGQDGAVVEIRRELGSAKSACENSIRRIGEKFGPSLGAFRFPPAIAQTLGDICRS